MDQRRVVVGLPGHEAEGLVQGRGGRHGRQRIELNPGIANVPCLVYQSFDQQPANTATPPVLPHVKPFQFTRISCQWPECHAADRLVVGQCQQQSSDGRRVIAGK